MSQFQVLLTGDVGCRDFVGPVQWLQGRTRLVRCDELTSAAGRLRDGYSPDVIVVAQACPGRFSAEVIEALYGEAPFTRIVALLGSWCEGEMRTGSPWPGVTRVYWHQFVAQAEFEFSTASRTRRPWQYPRTSTPAERVLEDSTLPLPRESGLIAIHTPDRVTFDSLAGAVSLGGYSSAWMIPGRPRTFRGATAGIWDAISCDARTAGELREVCTQLDSIPVVALLDYARRADARYAVEAGACGVVARPFRVDELIWQIRSALRLTRSRPRVIEAA